MKKSAHTHDATDLATLHSIGDAAEAAGLTPQALRMWEERYGRPVAVRLPSGHRRYTDDQVRWLRRVADALAHGHRAGAVVGLDDDALSALLAEALPDEALGKGPRMMLDWVASYGADEIRAWLDARWDADDYLKLLSEEIAPLLVAVGRGWADGELDVRHEHFLSQVLEDELRRLTQSSTKGAVTSTRDLYGRVLAFRAEVSSQGNDADAVRRATEEIY
ncbi:MAG: MerR family transcriptional regulator, partial [Planctomycetota bacterium]|nr:MerR family transcriptional regulator [Planctomycetota bacterium]